MIKIETILPTEILKGWYVDAGCTVAEAVMWNFLVNELNKSSYWWQRLEAEYVRRGFSPLSLEKFMEAVSREAILRSIGRKIEEGEVPILHAQQFYEERFFKANKSK